MMGYNGYSMSNRAVEAYEYGEKPISKWNKSLIIDELKSADIPDSKIDEIKKLPAKLLKEIVLKRTSWHHTSSHFNKTDFYSIDYAKIDNLTEESITALLQSYKAEPTEESNRYIGTIYYLEWSGTRKHPKATEKVLENVTIEEKGCFYYVTKDEKLVLKKKIGSNGTRVVRL